MYQGSQTALLLADSAHGCCLFGTMFYMLVCLIGMSSAKPGILPYGHKSYPSLLSYTSSASFFPANSQGPEAIEFTYYLSFQLLLKLFETFFNSRRHTFLHLTCSMRWENGTQGDKEQCYES